ncbi:MAG: glycosyltransferase [Leptolyngbya sp. SIOISBB]|nr:glycosyltransferase [Leptolyngbya sp. SIOISBB]
MPQTEHPDGKKIELNESPEDFPRIAVPTVSLVIPSYNRGAYLATAIESILGQTYPDFELLIWDDGSTDDSLEIAQSYAERDVRVDVVAAEHQGCSTSLQQAIAQTQGSYLGWVDSDDWLAPTALAETVAVLAAHPQVGWVYTNHQVVDAAGRVLGLGQNAQIPYTPQRLLVEFMTFHFRLLRRSAYEQVGGIDVTFVRAQDYDLCLRLSEVADVVHLPRPLYYYRRHGDNVTHNQIDMLRWTYQASHQALQRRGLSDRYEIHLRGELTLQPKLEAVPLVSIIIPCYNAAETIERCLQSCFEQTYPHLEVLVVENNSTDGTMAKLQAYQDLAPRPLRVLSCRQQGANLARNAGLSEAQGAYIQWLDADDQLMPDKIQRQVMALEQETAYDLATGDWQWCIDQQQRRVHRFSFGGQPQEDWLLQLLMDHWQPPHVYLLRRQVADTLHDIEAWHPQTPVCMEREYFTLAALQGMKVLYVPGAQAIYNSGLSPQITGTTPYGVRVQSLQTMFERFRSAAEQYEGLEGAHRFLLNQSWELWEPSFELIGQAEQVCWVRHQETQETQMLRDATAQIVQTWLELPGAYPLEDQARRIVRQLWQQTLVSIRQTRGLRAALDAKQVAHALAQQVGLVVGESEHHPVVTTDLDLEPELVALMQGCPLYTPLFGEQRLKVHTVLDSLRQQGWLRQSQDSGVARSCASQPVE